MARKNAKHWSDLIEGLAGCAPQGGSSECAQIAASGLHQLLEAGRVVVFGQERSGVVQLAEAGEPGSEQDPQALVCALLDEAASEPPSVASGNRVHRWPAMAIADDSHVILLADEAASLDSAVAGAVLFEGISIAALAAQEVRIALQLLHWQLNGIQTTDAALLSRQTASIAHELNNLLAAVLGYSDLLTHQGLNEDAMESLEAIRRSARKGGNLTAALWKLARRRG